MQNNYQDEISSLDKFNVQNSAQIHVYVEPSYLESKSKVGQYTFAYKVFLENIGDIAAQVIARHWIITDANNNQQEIKGLGIIGEQPLLQPGQKYEYTSTTVLSTTIGTMKGTYLCITENGELFPTTIREFTLALPRVLH